MWKRAWGRKSGLGGCRGRAHSPMLDIAMIGAAVLYLTFRLPRAASNH
jgi:hypothetical protein